MAWKLYFDEREWGGRRAEIFDNNKCNVEAEMYSTCVKEIEYVCVRAR